MFSCGRHFAFLLNHVKLPSENCNGEKRWTMDERNVYVNRSGDRRVTEQVGKEVNEQTADETDAEKAREDRRTRRDTRRRRLCRCGEQRKRRSKSKRRRIISQNPFIIFYLEMYFKTPGKHITEIARQAGKEWCALPQEERMKYIRLAEKERKRRRRGKKTGRRRGCPPQ